MASAAASKWTLFDRVLESRRFKKVLEHLPSNCTLADLGCGDGAFLRHINQIILLGYGIDAIKENAEEGKTIFKQGNLNERIPLADSSVQVVTALAVIEHLTNPQGFVEEAFRILKPSGKFILTTPSPKAKPVLEILAYKLKIISKNDIADHKHYFSKGGLISMLIKAGFRKIVVKPFQLGFNFLVVAHKEVSR